MVSAKACPSVDDCGNPAELTKKNWNLVFYDSQESNYPGYAAMAFDGDPNTIWHTRYSNGTDTYPHEIQVDLGGVYNIHRFIYLPRQEGTNGRIKSYELYFSENTNNWGVAAKTGEFKNSSSPETLIFDTPVKARYFKLKALSEVNGGAWTSIAELSAVGCRYVPTSNRDLDLFSNLSAFPVPATDMVTITLPEGTGFIYSLYSSSGQLIVQQKLNPEEKSLQISLKEYKSGIYLIRLVNTKGIAYRVKLVRE